MGPAHQEATRLANSAAREAADERLNDEFETEPDGEYLPDGSRGIDAQCNERGVEATSVGRRSGRRWRGSGRRCRETVPSHSLK